MQVKTLTSVGTALLAMFLFSVGCQEPSSPTKPADSHGDHDHDGHDHDHDHAGHDHDHDGHDHAEGGHDHPPHGPNHGHIFNFDSDDIKGEWCKYKDNDVIRMYLLDGKGEAPKPLVVEKFLVKPMVGNDETPFELEAEDVDPEGASASYMLDDKMLQTAIPLGVKIEVVTEGKTFTGEIKAHEPLDH
jgi:hypothetical protein